MSTPGESFDLARFQDRVGSITDQLDAVWTGPQGWSTRRFGIASTNDKNQAVEEVLNQVYRDASQAGEAIAPKDELRAAAVEARTALQTPSIRSRICSVIGPVAGKSSRSIAAQITTALIPMALKQEIAVPTTPMVWGLIAFTAAVLGTTWLCGEQN